MRCARCGSGLAEVILAQYRAYWALLQVLQQTARQLSPRLRSTRWQQTLKVAADRDAAGEALYGQIVLRPTVDVVRGQTVLVRDCQDTTNSGRIKVATGEKLTVGVPQVVRYTTLQQGADRQWRVSDIGSTPGGAC